MVEIIPLHLWHNNWQTTVQWFVDTGSLDPVILLSESGGRNCAAAKISFDKNLMSYPQHNSILV